MLALRMPQQSGSVQSMFDDVGRPELPQACPLCSCIKAAASFAAASIDSIKLTEEQQLIFFFSCSGLPTKPNQFDLPLNKALELLMEELERLKAFSFNHELLLQVQGSFANKVFLSRIRYHRYWYTILPDQITPVSSVRKLLDQGQRLISPT